MNGNLRLSINADIERDRDARLEKGKSYVTSVCNVPESSGRGAPSRDLMIVKGVRNSFARFFADIGGVSSILEFPFGGPIRR